MNYVGVVLFLLFPMYLVDSVAAYIAFLLAGRKMPYRKIFVLQVPAVLIQCMAYAAFTSIGEPADTLLNFLVEVLFSVADTVIIVSWVYFLFRKAEKKKRFFYVSMVYPFQVIASYGTNTLIGVITSWELLGADFTEVTNSPHMIVMLITLFSLVYGGVAVIVRLVSKTGFWNKLQAFENYPKLYIPMGMIYFLFYTVFRTIGAYLLAPWMMLAISLPYLALLALVVLMVSDIKRTENLTAAQNLLLQQQNYINKLEALQQELRSIQHDYKNMLSGLYAQASEGNAEAIKEYIDTKLLKVDETVREELRQMNQLTLIEIPELKGLVLAKILEAERSKVSIILEVMFPVVEAYMTIEDLLRCMGILLDNAIEEVQKQEGSSVTLLLLKEERALIIVVKNPVEVKPDLRLIWKVGYSTKGQARGIGLSNYQNIVRKYPNAIQETKIEGEYFIQVLALTENR